MECDFKLPSTIDAIVDKMISASDVRGGDGDGKRSFCVSNPSAPDNPIVYASPDFVELTGHDMHAILGHNCRFLQGPDTDKNEVKKLRVAIAEGRAETVVIKNYRKNGSAFWNRVHVCPVRDADGAITLVVGVQVLSKPYLSPYLNL
jgi:PAS domain S-box-containing protein